MKKGMEICNEGKEDILAKTEHSKRKWWWKLVWKKNICITR